MPTGETIMMPIPEPANDRVPSRLGPGALVLVVGPSGAGKDTLINRARERLSDEDRVVFPQRIVTRPPDATEASRAVDAAELELLVRAGATALAWQAHGLGYAVPAALDEDIANGRVAVVNVSRQIVPDALAKYARVTVVFVTAPREILAERIAGRGREAGADIAGRLDRATEALPAAPSLVMIQNVGDPEIGTDRLVEVIADLVAETR